MCTDFPFFSDLNPEASCGTLIGQETDVLLPSAIKQRTDNKEVDMAIESHGFSIGIERVGNEFFLTLKARGKLTHRDYEKITPLLDSALTEVKEPRVKVFIDGTEFSGWEPRAAWDDFKIGLKHGNKFEKIAIYGNKKWQERTAKIGNWFNSGEVRYFESQEAALQWLEVSPKKL